MTTITIPKKLAKNDDLIAIPRSEYDELVRIRALIDVAFPTEKEKRVVQRGRKEIRAKEYRPWSEVKKDLERRS